jgi:hypothetical protein
VKDDKGKKKVKGPDRCNSRDGVEEYYCTDEKEKGYDKEKVDCAPGFYCYHKGKINDGVCVSCEELCSTRIREEVERQTGGSVISIEMKEIEKDKCVCSGERTLSEKEQEKNPDQISQVFEVKY